MDRSTALSEHIILLWQAAPIVRIRRSRRAADLVAEVLRARNMSAATVTTYSAGARQLIAYLAEQGVTAAADVDRAALEEWIGQLLQSRSAATANNRYRAISSGSPGCWTRARSRRTPPPACDLPGSPSSRSRC